MFFRPQLVVWFQHKIANSMTLKASPLLGFQFSFGLVLAAFFPGAADPHTCGHSDNQEALAAFAHRSFD